MGRKRAVMHGYVNAANFAELLRRWITKLKKSCCCLWELQQKSFSSCLHTNKPFNGVIIDQFYLKKKKALQLFFKTFYILTISKKSEPTNTCLYNHPENRFHRHLFCWTINSRNPELISVLCRAEAIKPVAAAAGRCYIGHTPITMMAMRSRTITTSIPESTKRQKEA